MAEALTKDQINSLRDAGWAVDGGLIRKTYQFRDFAQALGWMVQVGVHAEKLKHHPDWSNSYRRVDVALTTHDAGGLTVLDLQLAQVMDGLAV